ncbi:hypothetical protein AUP68_17518 [Ilyonectria robusta]
MLRLLEKYPNGLADFYRDENQKAREENGDISVFINAEGGGATVKVEPARIDQPVNT